MKHQTQKFWISISLVIIFKPCNHETLSLRGKGGGGKGGEGEGGGGRREGGGGRGREGGGGVVEVWRSSLSVPVSYSAVYLRIFLCHT